MNFLWDMAVRAGDQGKQEEELFFIQAEEYSPFFEQAFSCLNEGRITSSTIELNLLYRYANIFQEILSRTLEEEMKQEGKQMPEFQKYLTDAVLHTLLYTDLRYGMTKREMYIRKLLEELRRGVFWTKAAENFLSVEGSGQIRLAALVLTQIQTGSSLGIFRRSLLVIFPEAILYQIRENRKKLLVYIKDKKTEKKEKAVRFIQDIFLPVSYELRVFWEYPVGIIGISAAMKIDETALY